MKLTDEQRAIYRHLAESDNPIIMLPRAEFNFILSSEQAWKEEAERLEKRMKGYESQAIKNINRAEEAEEKLNQAIEVLKKIEQMDEGWITGRIAGDFLSSLNKEETP